jgi:predicted signal transduction protein with EAL and GGDEF domain
VRLVLSGPVDVGGTSVRTGVSVGMVSALGSGRTPSALLDAADVALYTAKERGRGQVVTAQEIPQARLRS